MREAAAARLAPEPRTLEEIGEGIEAAALEIARRVASLARAVRDSAAAGHPLAENAVTMECRRITDAEWEIIRAREALDRAATVRTMQQDLGARQAGVPEPEPLPRRRSSRRREGGARSGAALVPVSGLRVAR